MIKMICSKNKTSTYSQGYASASESAVVAITWDW